MVENITTIEHDIAELEKMLQERKASLEQEKSGGTGSSDSHPSEKEILREVVGEKIKQHIPSYAPSQPATQPQDCIGEPPSYFTQELKDKVHAIITLIFSKNIEEGIKEASKSSNPALIDALHDILTDELYGQLIEKGKLQKVD